MRAKTLLVTQKTADSLWLLVKGNHTLFATVAPGGVIGLPTGGTFRFNAGYFFRFK